MLGSDQVSRQVLLEALMEEYYLPLYRLGLYVLDDRAAALRIAQSTIASALANKYSYRDLMGVDVWLYSFALEACRKADQVLFFKRGLKATIPRGQNQEDDTGSRPNTLFDANLWLAFDSLSVNERFALVLQHLRGWAHEDVARLYQIPEERLQSRLATALSKLVSAAQAEGQAPEDLEVEGQDRILADSLRRRWPATEAAAEASLKTLDQIERMSARDNLRRRAVSHIREIILVSFIILVAAGVFWAGNIFFADEELPTPQVPTVLVTKIIVVESTRERGNAMPEIRATSTPGPTAVPEDALYRVAGGEQIEEIAAKLGVSEQDLRQLNRLPSDSTVFAGQQLLIPGRISSNPFEVTPVAPMRPGRPLQVPLTGADILQHMRRVNNLYHTLWFDALVVDYGPLGYIGPPKSLRVQAWLSEAKILFLAGEPHTGPEEVLLWTEGRWHRAAPGEGQPWFFRQDEIAPGQIQFYQELELLLSSVTGGDQEIATDVSLMPLERTAWAGQSTILVEGKDAEDRRTLSFWLEDTRGVVLRKQWYTQADPEVLAQEIAIMEIGYDIDFPQELFDARLPWRGGFAEDHRGGPEAQRVYGLPAFVRQVQRSFSPLRAEAFDLDALDFIEGQLTFYFKNSFNPYNPAAPADLYLERRYIGTVLFGNPWTMICQRSPDGRNLAYVSQPGRAGLLDPQLRWLNLDAPLSRSRSLDEIIVTNFSWAPDSRRLAVFGYDPLDPFRAGKLIILDSKTGEYKSLLEADAANSLVWRPDGERLAFIVRPFTGSFEEQVWVIETENGGLINRIPIDVDNAYSDIWPMEDWGVEFPALMDTFETCAAPVSQLPAGQ
jgi:RNA polymerase sigma-70 factor (ECF subfamily)